MAEPQKTSLVTITNNGPGPRYVHGVEKAVTVAPKETSEPFEITAGEREAAEANPELEVKAAKRAAKATAAPTEDGKPGEDDPLAGVPDDLKDSTKRDGLKTKDALLELAKDESVALEGDDTKPVIIQKIIAHRAAKAAAGTGDDDGDDE